MNTNHLQWVRKEDQDQDQDQSQSQRENPIYVVMDLAVERNKHEPESTSHKGKWGQQGWPGAELCIKRIELFSEVECVMS